MPTAPGAAPLTVGPDDLALATAELELGGMHCSACATRIQKTLGRLPAVASASVNLATTRAFVSYDPARLDTDQLCRAVSEVGYTAAPVDRRPVRDRPVRSRPLAPTGCRLVALGPGRAGGGPVRAGVGRRRLDGAGAGGGRRVRRWLALPAGQRPAAAPRRHQHGHADRPGHAVGPGGQCRRGHRPRWAPRPSRGERRLRRPTPRGHGPADRGHPGEREGRRGPGPGPGRPGPALAPLPAAPGRPRGGRPRRRHRRAGGSGERPGRGRWSGCVPARPCPSTGRWCRDGLRSTSPCSPASPCRWSGDPAIR